jgi:hypothetical protein
VPADQVGTCYIDGVEGGMTQSNPGNSKGLARKLSIVILAFVAIPVFAVLTLGLRFLIPVVLVTAAAAAVFSPAFRRWFS